jgi:BMFP domain-containing protein YqiC
MARDRVTELQARIEELEERIREMERREEQSVDRMIRRLVPDDVREHLRHAQKEQLLAVRSMLDHWIARTERSAEPPRRRESITVE